MSDVKQAAKWMRDGQRVTRAEFNGYPIIYDESEQDLPACQIADVVHLYNFTISDLLADDWEIAE